jgi:hypothetical protein
VKKLDAAWTLEATAMCARKSRVLYDFVEAWKRGFLGHVHMKDVTCSAVHEIWIAVFSVDDRPRHRPS